MNRAITLLLTGTLGLLSACGAPPAEVSAPTAAPSNPSPPLTAPSNPSPSPSPPPSPPPTAPAEPPKAVAPAAKADLCPVADDAALATCLGKQVALLGAVPKMVHQHPVLTGGPGRDGLTQDYMDLATGRQMVILVKGHVNCRGKMKATGTLKSISGEGPPGSKGSYKNYYLTDATVECL